MTVICSVYCRVHCTYKFIGLFISSESQLVKKTQHLVQKADKDKDQQAEKL